MTRMSGARSVVTLLTCLLGPAAQPAYASQQAAPGPTQQPAPKAMTFDGDVALWTVAIKADKTADFEAIMTKLRDGLAKSAKPERRQQAAGWRVMKMPAPMADGTIAYVHIINPVVRDADYTVMQVLYDEFPDERLALYEKYRAAFAKNLSLAVGPVVLDMSRMP